MSRQDDLCPWNQPDAATWLSGNEALRRFTRLVERTLENDPRQFPLQIRAAAAAVILLCRRGLWANSRGEAGVDDVVDQARRCLAQVRQYYSTESKRREDVAGHDGMAKLLKSIEEELRILDARLSESPIHIPDEPPPAWGLDWPKK